jgi:hypothetical protein
MAATVTPAGGKNAGPIPAPNVCHDNTEPAKYGKATQPNKPAAYPIRSRVLDAFMRAVHVIGG